jgi:hypothetical protein
MVEVAIEEYWVFPVDSPRGCLGREFSGSNCCE